MCNLKFSDGSCMTLIPDATDNLTNVMSALSHFWSALYTRYSLGVVHGLHRQVTQDDLYAGM